MAVTPGTQDSDMGLTPEADRNKGSTVGKEFGRTGTMNDSYNVEEEQEVEGPFKKV